MSSYYNLTVVHVLSQSSSQHIESNSLGIDQNQSCDTLHALARMTRWISKGLLVTNFLKELWLTEIWSDCCKQGLEFYLHFGSFFFDYRTLSFLHLEKGQPNCWTGCISRSGIFDLHRESPSKTSTSLVLGWVSCEITMVLQCWYRGQDDVRRSFTSPFRIAESDDWMPILSFREYL